MYLNSFVSRIRHKFLHICQVCISKEFWSGLCGLFSKNSSFASPSLFQKRSPVRMAFFDSFRGTNKPSNGAKKLLREANKPSNGAKRLLREAKQPRNGANENVLRHTETFLRETKYHSNVTENVRRITENSDNSEDHSLDKACAFPLKAGKAIHISSNIYDTRSTFKNEFISKSNNFSTTNASVKSVPSFECKNKDNNSSYRSKLSKCMENHRHSMSCSKQVCRKSRDREPSRISVKKLLNC